jgi:hypothetical protein
MGTAGITVRLSGAAADSNRVMVRNDCWRKQRMYIRTLQLKISGQDEINDSAIDHFRICCARSFVFCYLSQCADACVAAITGIYGSTDLAHDSA